MGVKCPEKKRHVTLEFIHRIHFVCKSNCNYMPIMYVLSLVSLIRRLAHLFFCVTVFVERRLLVIVGDLLI